MTRRPARSATPLPSTARSTSITVPPGRAPALAGAGAAGGGPAGVAPRIFSVARSSAFRPEGTVLTSCPPMSTCTLNSSAHTCASCPARCAPILIRCTAGITPSTPLAEITVSNSTAPADCAPISTGPAGAGGAAGSGAGCGAGPARPGSGRVPGRNRLAGVAMPSAWCGRAWL